MTEKTKIIAGMEIQEDVLKLRIEKEQLEQTNNKLLDVINGQDVKIADLEKQIEKMKSALIDIKSNTDDVNIEWQIKYLFDELEIKENAEQKNRLEKAKDLIEDMYDKIPASHSDYYKDVMERARQFIKEIEK